MMGGCPTIWLGDLGVRSSSSPESWRNFETTKTKLDNWIEQLKKDMGFHNIQFRKANSHGLYDYYELVLKKKKILGTA